MAKARKVKTVRYVYEWESDLDGTGTVTAWIEFQTHNSKAIYRKDVKFELAEAVGDSLINRLRRDMIL